MTGELLREQIRRTVAGISPADPIEVREQASVLAWIDSNAPLFREHGSIPARHLAVYFAVLDPVRRSVLQVDHRKAQAWVFPGGHVDAEPPAEAVVREAKEELGIDGEFHLAFGDRPLLVTESRTRPPGEHVDVTLWYVLDGSEGMPLTGDPGEFLGLRWSHIDEPESWIGTCYAPSQVTRFLAKVRHTLDTAPMPA
ncbi:NUDIX domain-containing protein [Pseudosporangium ferrugineum]|uniref:ADP-ribose pyrophosphatase YjhB (NUDIX family) n=1 Tax=Pseudosporangium ferrugineum TaxID=439699 RepID=A0A2T0RBV8_9ACTN|nr:NUDIX domain-containing protein [Pseudosporangium ferrugineum]PRY18627.1 ADP-ribose pyrophosphatase YjhB (NUDIX family) [Pseudosporangium ferrugineum]